MEMRRCLLHDKGLPKKFWAEATNTAIFLQNRLPMKALQKKMPFEAWYGDSDIIVRFIRQYLVLILVTYCTRHWISVQIWYLCYWQASGVKSDKKRQIPKDQAFYSMPTLDNVELHEKDGPRVLSLELPPFFRNKF